MKKLTAGVCFCAISAFLALAEAVACCAFALFAQASYYGRYRDFIGRLIEYTLPVFAIISLIIGVIFIVWSIVEEIVNKKKEKSEVTDEQ